MFGKVHVCSKEKIPDDRLRRSIDDELSGFSNNFAEWNEIIPKDKTFTDRKFYAGEWAPMPKISAYVVYVGL